MVSLDITQPLPPPRYLDEPQEVRLSPPRRRNARSCIPGAVWVIAAGVFLVACAYMLSRAGSGIAPVLFWTGQVAIFAVVAYRVLNSSTTSRDRICLVLLFAGAQAVIRWAYSPHMFTYADELQHYRSLLNVLSSHHLFETNYSLPVSPTYPGMENVTAELAQISGVTPFIAGVIVAGASHVLLAACLLLLFREVSHSSRAACIGVLVYLLNPNAHYFDTSFHYEAVALPFLALTIFIAVRFATRQDGYYRNLAALLACDVIVVLTHHLAALVTSGLLVCIALSAAVFRGSRHLVVPFAIGGALTAMVAGYWMFFFAPSTGDYLDGSGQQILNGLLTLGGVDGKVGLPAPPTPMFDRLLSPAGVVLTLGLLVASIWFTRSNPALQRVFVWLAPASYVSVIAIRVFVANGAELSSRAMTYTSIFSALAIGLALDRVTSPSLRRHRRSTRRPFNLGGAFVMTTVLFLSGIATGIPEWWERLPGSFHVDGFASGVDEIGVSRAEWANSVLEPGSRFFGDVTSTTLLATLAQLDPVRAPESLYYTDHLTQANVDLIDAQSARYLDVDLRMTQQMPVTGNYFPVDIRANEHKAPIDPSALIKFDNVPGISRIYDSGVDRFYDLRAAQELTDGT
jgi:hypothetical protein